MANPEAVGWFYDNLSARFLVQTVSGFNDAIGLDCCETCQQRLRQFPDLEVAMRNHVPPPAPDPKVAEKRAQTLLMSLLPDKEAKRFAKNQFFEFDSQLGYRYRIFLGYTGNVYNITAGKRYCCYILDRVPTHDHMLAQYLCLKYNEQHFLDTAY